VCRSRSAALLGGLPGCLRRCGIPLGRTGFLAGLPNLGVALRLNSARLCLCGGRVFSCLGDRNIGVGAHTIQFHLELPSHARRFGDCFLGVRVGLFTFALRRLLAPRPDG
jgi:hypothetical protein